MNADVLIIGSGIAGLSFAIKLAERCPHSSIALVTKADRFESNTKYAQGGIAAVMDNVQNSFESHIRDTLKAGKGFSNPKTVQLVVKKAPKRLRELINWGAPFDKTTDGNWDYGLEGGHSVARILHHKDQTGLALEKALLGQLKRFKNIHFFTECFATDVLVDENTCFGARFLNASDKKFYIHSKITYLATGGSGQVFSKTTNPLIATGDGLAMAARAGANIEAMKFYQFHPTALAVSKNPLFLISEAIRGFGAHLINQNGERFLFKHHPDGELATRDIVTQLIFSEIYKNGLKNVWLDCRHLEKKALQKQFPNIIAQCKNLGIDVFKEPIPVAPAAHYQCGGIQVDQRAKTSIKNLYANGECASTGLHGANRLASNSLLEAVVFAHEAALDVAKELRKSFSLKTQDRPASECLKNPAISSYQITKLKTFLQQLMYDFYLNTSMNRPAEVYKIEVENFFSKLNNLTQERKESKALWELKNMAEVSRFIIKDTCNE